MKQKIASVVIMSALLACASRTLPKYIVLTGYCPCLACCDYWAHLPDRQRTFADGTRFDRHAKVCAVDTRVFKFGTRFFVPGFGEYVAHDTGGKVKGAHVDLLFASHEDAVRFGRRRLPLVRD